MGVADLHRLPKFVQAQIDPFDANVIGVKIPDSNTYPSTSIKCEDAWTGLTTDANGLRAQAFLPMLKNNRIDATGATPSTWTWAAAYAGGNDSSRLTPVAANNALIRPVAHGLRITCNTAPTSVSGSLHVCIYAGSSFGKTTWNFVDNISQMSNAMFYKRYTLAALTQQPLTIVNKFLDCTATKYFDPNADGIDNAGDVSFQTNGWASIIIVVEGAAANSPCLNVEQVIHMEGIASRGGIDSVSPAAQYSIDQLQAASRMGSQVQGAFVESERSSYLSEVAGNLGNVIGSSARAAVRDYVLPAAGRAAYAGFGYAARRAFGMPGVTDFRNPSAFQTLTY